MRILIDGQTLLTPEINRGIGVYFKNCIEACLKNNASDEFYLTAYSHDELKYFSPWAARTLIPILNPAFNPSGGNSRKFTEVLDREIQRNNIDCYWTPNPLMQNVLLAENRGSCLFGATIHDLIPLALQEIYFTLWERKNIESYQARLKILEQQYQLFFHVSENTRQDVKKFLNAEDSIHCVTYEACGDCFVPLPFPERGVDEEYILLVGGFDPRKNMERALEAFALLLRNHPESWIQELSLSVICAADDDSRKRFLLKAEELGISERIRFLGEVEHLDLIRHYQRTRAFFFPSLYEGFGLPVLEALACGIPVACSNSSSLPEVAGEQAHYFNPLSADSMAEGLAEALSEPVDDDSRRARYEYSRSFSWDKTARILLEAIRDKVQPAIDSFSEYRKIAWFSPLPPQKSGIADFNKLLLYELQKHCEIEIFSGCSEVIPEIAERFAIYPFEEFEKRKQHYTQYLYHLGNNSEFHREIYKAAWEHPGTIILHDFNLAPFLHQTFYGTNDERLYRDALVEGYGDAGRREYERGALDIWKFPLSKAIVERSRKVIVHNRWAKRQFPESRHVSVIPLFATLHYQPAAKDVRAFKQLYEIDEQSFLISCIGFINRNKLPDLQIRVLEQLRESGFPVILMFAGEFSDELRSLKAEIRKSADAKSIICTGYLDEEAYFTAIAASDVVLNLRNPTLGETSGTLMHSLAAGSPTIVSDQNQYAELPDEVAWKVPHDGSEERLLYAYVKTLLSRRELRQAMSGNQVRYARDALSIERIAQEYLRVINAPQ